MIPLLDTSGRVLLWSKRGDLYLGSSGSDLRLITSPFIDLTKHVHHEAQGLPGMISVATDEATDEGRRLFVSYTTVMADNCSYLVIEELLAASADEVTPADPSQVRRVFSMNLTDAHSSSALLDYAGQILWRHTDAASLYLATGPTASEPQGKIIRLHVDKTPGPGDKPIEAEVFATFLGIPRKCSFDSDKPDDLYCASIEAQQEVVYLISDGQTTSVVMTHERPATDTAPSIVGGLMYRGSADSSLFGSYIYLHNSAVWVAVESPAASRHYAATQISLVMCPSTSPFPCHDDNIIGSAVSFAEDGNRNAFVIATDGVYRVVAPSLCRTSTRAPKQLHFPNWLIALLAVVVPAILGGTVAYTIRCQCCNRDVHNNA